MASIISAGTTSGTSLNLSADTSGVLQLATNGTTTAVTIDTSQNVGVGTSSPASKLHISGGSTNIARVDGSSSGGAWAVMRAGSITGGMYNTGAILGNTTSGLGLFAETGYDIRFYTNGTTTERMRITSGGDVLFPYNTAIAWNSTANQYIQADSNAIYLGTANEYRILISTNGNATFKNNISVGNATPTTSGTGITFPATQSASSDANTLDDYEEGTWTPTDASGAGLSLTVNQAQYTKIGRLVFVYCFVLFPTNSNSSNILIGGLPFVSASGANQNYELSCRYQTGSTIPPLGQIGTSSTTISMVAQYNFSGTAFPNSTLSGGNGLIFSGCYLST